MGLDSLFTPIVIIVFVHPHFLRILFLLLTFIVAIVVVTVIPL